MRRPPLSPIAGVYAILDLPLAHALEPVAVVEALIEGGARVVQLRAKHARADERRRLAELIVGPCRAAGIPLIINDDLELAEAGDTAGISGVHLGQGDLDRLGPDAATRTKRRERLRARGLILGVSTHDLEQLRETVATLEPDYVGFGPVFATASKLNPDPVVGLELLAVACSESPVPVVAIGGVDSNRAAGLARAGASAIAAIGALTGETVDIVRARTFALARSFAGSDDATFSS